MKKNQLLTTCLTLSCLLTAMTGYSTNSVLPLNISNDLSLKDGFYLGAAGGYDNYNMSKNINSVSIITSNPIDPNILPSPPLSLQFKQNASENNGAGGLFAGYGRSFPQHKTYLGIEIFGNWTNAKSTSNSWIENSIYANNTDFPNQYPGYYLSSQDITSTIQVNNNYGFNIHPGIKLRKSSLLYISLGYGLSSISSRQSINSTVSFQDKIFNITPVGSAVSNANSSHTIGGFAYGIGIEQAVYKTWSLRAEYIRTDYSDLNSNATGSIIKASDNRYMLGIIYHL